MKSNRNQYHHHKKINKKHTLIVIGIILVLSIIIFIEFNRIQLLFKGYNFTDQSIILKLDQTEIDKYLKSEKINQLSSWNQFNNDQHYQTYNTYKTMHSSYNNEKIIDYVDTFYQRYYDRLIEMNYSDEILFKMMKNASLTDFDFLIQNQLSYDKTKSFLNIKGVIYTDMPSYIKDTTDPLQAILNVTYPFINAKNKPKNTFEVLNPDSYQLLIKKGFKLPSSYVPKDLITPNVLISPDCSNSQLRSNAAKALEQMAQDASKEGLYIGIKSAYRSYEDQKSIYDEYFKKYDALTAAGLVAIPGSSEHQIGLGVDLTSQSVIDSKRRFFGDTDEYKWVVKNAYKYGYILRYPPDKSEITGTTNEPWHFRFVGKKVAKTIYDNQWTLEEYTLKYGLSSDFKISNE